MKLIKSIVRPNKVDEVKAALEKLQISGMTVTEVRGHGKQKGHTAIYRGQEYNVSLLPKMEVEVVVPDSMADDAIRAIIEAARTGVIGFEPERSSRRSRSACLAIAPFTSAERRRGSGCGRRLQILDDEDLLTWPNQAKFPTSELFDGVRIVFEATRLVPQVRVLGALTLERD